MRRYRNRRRYPLTWWIPTPIRLALDVLTIIVGAYAMSRIFLNALSTLR